jgi:hypothetical protein
VNIAGTMTFNGSIFQDVYNVMEYGAIGNGATDDTAAIAATFVAAAAGGRVFFPLGTYLISSSIVINNLQNLDVVGMAGSTIKTNSSIVMIQVRGNSSQIRISDLSLDGNNVATGGIISTISTSAATSPSFLTVDGCYIKNIAGTGIGASENGTPGRCQFNVKDIRYINNRVENCTGKCISSRFVDGLIISGNLVDGLACLNVPAIGMDSCLRVTVDHNIVENVYGVDYLSGGIRGFGAALFAITGNIVRFSATATGGNGIYIDTPYQGSVTGNSVHMNNAGSVGILMEVAESVAITGNHVYNSSAEGIVLAGRNDDIQRNSLDTTTDLIASSDVTLSIDGADFQEGTGSLRMQTTVNTGAGVLFYQDHPTIIDYSAKVPSDNNARTRLEIWVKAAVTLTHGQLEIWLSDLAGLASPTLQLPIPAIQAGNWVRVKVAQPSSYQLLRNVKSWGIASPLTPGVMDIRFDDWSVDTPSNNVTVVGNSILKAGDYGILVKGYWDGAVISGNTIHEAGWNGNVNARAVAIIPSLSTQTIQNIKISENVCSYTLHSNPTNSCFRLDNGVGGTITNVLMTGNVVVGYSAVVNTSGTIGSNVWECDNIINGTVNRRFKSYGDEDAGISIDVGVGTVRTGGIDFRSNGSTKWSLQKFATSDGFQIFDTTNGFPRLGLAQGGANSYRGGGGATSHTFTDSSGVTCMTVTSTGVQFPQGININTSGTLIKQMRLFTAVAVDPGSIAATSRGSIAVTVAGTPGISVGDVIIPVQGINGINDDLVFEGVTATGANQVTFFFYNPTAGAIDDTSHNWDIMWMDVT